MIKLQRNQLVWLHETSWQRLLGNAALEPLDREILAHWQSRQLPCVLCTQRSQHRPPTLSLGLPAPTKWDRRKIGLEVSSQDIVHVGAFPALEQVVTSHLPELGLRDLLAQLTNLCAPVEVYGSYGWQFLTGLSYVRPTSDLDVIAKVSDLSAALAVAEVFRKARLSCRLDGEVLFPDGRSIAWRELLQGAQGIVDRVLVKTREQVSLVQWSELVNEELTCTT
jgi:phosphoribosyl-dephospho-CoA transferase